MWSQNMHFQLPSSWRLILGWPSSLQSGSGSGSAFGSVWDSAGRWGFRPPFLPPWLRASRSDTLSMSSP